MRSLIDIRELSVEEIDELVKVANDIIDNPAKYSEKCKGKILATLFFEPSTRTRLSFESAMLNLGGNVIGFSDAQNSSASKGESVADTTKIVSGYADIIVKNNEFESTSPYYPDYGALFVNSFSRLSYAFCNASWSLNLFIIPPLP